MPPDRPEKAGKRACIYPHFTAVLQEAAVRSRDNPLEWQWISLCNNRSGIRKEEKILNQESYSYAVRKFDRPNEKERAKARLNEEDGSFIRKLTLVFVLIVLVASEIISVLDSLSEASGAVGLIAGICSIAAALLLALLGFGYLSYIMKTARRLQNAGYDELKTGFGPLCAKVIVLAVLMDLFIALWSLLFVIPGIWAAYRYRFAFYILLDNPGLTAREALNRSKEMTRGRKGEQFVLDLSFLGWILLAVLLQTVGAYVGAFLGALLGSTVLAYLLSIILSVVLAMLIAVRLTAYKGIVDIYFYDFARVEYNYQQRISAQAGSTAGQAGCGGQEQIGDAAAYGAGSAGRTPDAGTGRYNAGNEGRGPDGGTQSSASESDAPEAGADADTGSDPDTGNDPGSRSPYL